MYSYYRWPETQFDHDFWCFTRHHRHQDERIFRSYGSCGFQPCMRTGWILEMYPLNFYWHRYEVGEWLVFGWFWSWGTLDMQLARQKLGKKHTPQSWWLPLPKGHHGHGALPRNHHIQQLANILRDKSKPLKLESIITFTMYLLAILRHDTSLTYRAWVFAGCMVLKLLYSQLAALRL